MILERLFVARFKGVLETPPKYGHSGRYAHVQQDTVLFTPDCYMNESGENIKKICQAFQIEKCNVIIIYDDKETKLGKVKVKKSGKTMKGHNGIISVKEKLTGPGEFFKIAVGVGTPEDALGNRLTDGDAIGNWLLQDFSKWELEEMNRMKTVNEVAMAIHQVLNGRH